MKAASRELEKSLKQLERDLKKLAEASGADPGMTSTLEEMKGQIEKIRQKARQTSAP
ncbi:MAG: hypothetical protein HUU15_11320 [Candidatus Brocadiae bacterium]|nr:hypothetical protein [Candidatus Brocadiia bacterium]